MDCCCAAEAVSDGAELIAASSASESANPDKDAYFTKALITHLKQAAQDRMTVATLHANLIEQRESLKIYHLPYYCLGQRTTSVVLQKLEGNQKGKAPVKTPIIKKDSTRILLTVYVDETMVQGQTDSIKKWLLNLIPPSFKNINIKLEGTWDTSSSLLLFSVPIQVWTQLPDNQAWTFVGMVESNNKLLDRGSREVVLATMPKVGGENVRPGSGSLSK
jgi:hypothetical protein